MDFGTGTNRTYNIISLGFVVAAVFACIITLLLLLLGNDGSDDEVAFVLPTEIVIPSATLTETPLPRTELPASFTPTFTPTGTIAPTLTPTATFTISPTVPPSETITTTPLATLTPTETLTGVPTLGTPPPSPSPFLFALQVPPSFEPNRNASGCAWQGIGGQVLDLEGNAYGNQLQISVIGGGLPAEIFATNGANTLYGAGGFELQVANSINTQTYFVQLKTTLGTPVSDVIQVPFTGVCEGNLAVLTFQQTRPN
ncbi:MAG: hypothetical protein Phog2KO_13340 [Phototrophicaceae bacterium]